MTQRRPYRSHKIPACDRCRRFKRRCTGGGPGHPCVLCNLQEVACEYSSVPRPRGQLALSRPNGLNRKVSQRNPQPSHPPRSTTAVSDGEAGQDQVGPNYHGSADGQGRARVEHSMVACPVISEDIHILERYMSSQVRTGSGAPTNPMVYLRVPRRREGLSVGENPGKQQKEILMQILKPYADELLHLYFEHIHPAFPIFDQHSFFQLYQDDKLSPTLTCDFFAFSLILWQQSPSLRCHPQPDSRFIWNLAVEALQEDFFGPGLSTVYSVVLDMLGRPVYSVLWNTVNNGRAVSLAQSLGLNRNPSGWKRPNIEKELRIRLWWAILIHDHWSSFAHGTPPLIRKNQHDVPIPSLDLTGDTHRVEKDIIAATCFSGLCRLTDILGDILSLAYNLSIDQRDIWRQIRRLESDLDSWEEHMPANARPVNGDQRKIPGCSSLQLGYLTVRLLLKRVALHAATVSVDDDRRENIAFRLAQLRRSAQEIVNYVCYLTNAQLQEFWLPYTAHHLILAMIILLRCTVESPDHDVAQSCRSDLDRFWTKLQAAAKEGWDLANICITQCAESVSKILSLSASSFPDSDGLGDRDLLEVGPSALLELPEEGGGTLMHYVAPELAPDILPFSNPDISFDNQWDFGSWYGLGFTGIGGISSRDQVPDGFQGQ